MTAGWDPGHAIFHDRTVAWSSSDLLDDLRACRQLRVIGDETIKPFVYELFGTEKFVRVYEALEAAFERFGYCCDICGAITEVDESKRRKAADRALDNLDGRVRLMLCRQCDQRYERFTRHHFGQSVRVPYSDRLEKIMLAFIAFAVRTEARKVAFVQTTAS